MSFGGGAGPGGGMTGSTAAYRGPTSAGYQGGLDTYQHQRGWIAALIARAQPARATGGNPGATGAAR